MLIYLTRHGESEWNVLKRAQGSRKEIQLTKKGVSQAEALASRLKSEGITSIYSSDLDRAYSTAEIIGNKLGCLPQIAEELREVCLGNWEGLTRSEIEAQYPGHWIQWQTDCLFSPKSGESLSYVKRRLNHFVKRLFSIEHKDKRILLVSHAITSKILLTELLNMPVEYNRCFKLDNTGLSIIETDEIRSRAVCINDTCHMPK